MKSIKPIVFYLYLFAAATGGSVATHILVKMTSAEPFKKCEVRESKSEETFKSRPYIPAPSKEY